MIDLEATNEVLAAKKVSETKKDFNEKKPAEKSLNTEVECPKGKIINLSGKKIKNTLIISRGAEVITFKKGVRFEDIPAKYKSGSQRIVFREKHFE